MKKSFTIAAAALILFQGCIRPNNGEFSLHILSTNDIHGAYFDSTYTGGRIKKSLLAVKACVDSVRKAEGKRNVILIDAGDFLQGDNAAYYFNYVDTTSPHIFTRMAKYMGYDAVIGGNHDIETGHPVYDRISKSLEEEGIPFLAGNAMKKGMDGRYFPTCSIIYRHGIKIAVLGYDNANIKAWLNESLWSGMVFTSLIPLVQNDVNALKESEDPQIVIVAVHSGTGEGDGTQLEDQGLDLYNSLSGVDVLICGHDHKPFTISNGEICLLNSGSHCNNVGHGTVNIRIKNGNTIEKSVETPELIRIDAEKTDKKMKSAFREDYLKVKAFTLTEVGELNTDLHLEEALTGMSDYINLIHTVCLNSTAAQLSIVAPLATRGTIKAGTLLYNDLFNLYKYENQLFVVQLKGEEIRNYLEASYDSWIRTASKPYDHVLNIALSKDPQTGKERWNFSEPTYNFDSMAGLFYTVDVTKPYGSRVKIAGMANGDPFVPEATYNVAMTSYRASGGGGLLQKIGVDTDNIEERVVQKYPEIRELLYGYLQANGVVDPSVIGNPATIGHWEFIPEEITAPGIAADMKLIGASL